MVLVLVCRIMSCLGIVRSSEDLRHHALDHCIIFVRSTFCDRKYNDRSKSKVWAERGHSNTPRFARVSLLCSVIYMYYVNSKHMPDYTITKSKDFDQNKITKELKINRRISLGKSNV